MGPGAGTSPLGHPWPSLRGSQCWSVPVSPPRTYTHTNVLQVPFWKDVVGHLPGGGSHLKTHLSVTHCPQVWPERRQSSLNSCGPANTFSPAPREVSGHCWTAHSHPLPHAHQSCGWTWPIMLCLLFWKWGDRSTEFCSRQSELEARLAWFLTQAQCHYADVLFVKKPVLLNRFIFSFFFLV